MNMIEGLGPVRVRNLIDALGSPRAVMTCAPDDLLKAKGVGSDLASKIVAQRSEVDADAEEEKAAKLGARIITVLDDEYPESLKHIHDPPLALYILGGLEKKDRHAIGVVGSRRCTHYGINVADRLSYQMAQVGFVVVSGLARGIDTAAHRGCLKGGGRTLAVLGSGLDKLYPPESEELAEAIAGQGAVISEYPIGREPDRTTFPYRNRVVSGLCMGLLVVEAGAKSGALHTADSALEQGRSVFAVPGRIDSAASRGTHRLLQNGARLVTDVKDIVEEFETLIPMSKLEEKPVVQALPAIELTEEEQAITKALLGGSLSVDEVSRQAGLPSARLSALLIGLEMKRVVRMLPGRLIELTVQPGLDS
jgi:DNA processing protein